MKKILLTLVALSILFTFVSCGEPEELEPIDKFKSIYELSEPTMVVTEVVEIHGVHTLNASYTFVRGQVDGMDATQYIATYDKLETVEDGISDVVTGPITTVHETKEYVEGKGIRENGGSWKKGEDFAPNAGAFILNVSEELLPDYSYYENVFAATIDRDNTEAVLGVDIDADVELEITTNGVVITAVSISYEIEEDDDYPAITVTINTVYSYDVQAITLVKGK